MITTLNQRESAEHEKKILQKKICPLRKAACNKNPDLSPTCMIVLQAYKAGLERGKFLAMKEREAFDNSIFLSNG